MLNLLQKLELLTCIMKMQKTKISSFPLLQLSVSRRKEEPLQMKRFYNKYILQQPFGFLRWLFSSCLFDFSSFPFENWYAY